MECQYLKRSAKVCRRQVYKGAGTLCADHLGAIPYKMCEGKCGGVVSSKHGRARCTSCDRNAAARASRDKTFLQRQTRVNSARRKASLEPKNAGAGAALPPGIFDEVLGLAP